MFELSFFYHLISCKNNTNWFTIAKAIKQKSVDIKSMDKILLLIRSVIPKNSFLNIKKMLNTNPVQYKIYKFVVEIVVFPAQDLSDCVDAPVALILSKQEKVSRLSLSWHSRGIRTVFEDAQTRTQPHKSLFIRCQRARPQKKRYAGR